MLECGYISPLFFYKTVFSIYYSKKFSTFLEAKAYLDIKQSYNLVDLFSYKSKQMTLTGIKK